MEIVVEKNTVTIYILEIDIANNAKNAAIVSVFVQFPRMNIKKQKLSLDKNQKIFGYSATFQLPPNARRVRFHLRRVLDGKKEMGKIQYEPEKNNLESISKVERA